MYSGSDCSMGHWYFFKEETEAQNSAKANDWEIHLER